MSVVFMCVICYLSIFLAPAIAKHARYMCVWVCLSLFMHLSMSLSLKVIQEGIEQPQFTDGIAEAQRSYMTSLQMPLSKF